MYKTGTGPYDRGRASSIKYRDGTSLSLAYGSDGQLLTATDQYGNQLNFTWNRYDGTGALTTLKEVTYPGGGKTRYSYVGQNSASGVGSATDLLSKAEQLAPDGTVLDSETYLYENAAFPMAMTGIINRAGVRTDTFTYDDYGRPISTEQNGGTGKLTFTYGTASGFSTTTTVTDLLGKATTYYYNGENSLLHLYKMVTAATANTPAATTTYAYDSNKLLQSVTDAEGRVTRYTRDATGLMTQKIEGYGTPQAVTTNYVWDIANRRLQSETSPRLKTEYAYDTDGHTTSVTETDLTANTVPYSTNGQVRIWTYTYDAKGRLASKDGPLAGTQDTTTYAYNAQGRLTTVTNALGQVSTASQWNSRGQPTHWVDASGLSIDIAYDELGRPTSITKVSDEGSALWGFAYDAVGNLSRLTLPGGVTYDYTYTSDRQLDTITNGSVEKVKYQYDNMGNPTKTEKTDGQTPESTLFEETRQLDALGRLNQLITGAGGTYVSAWDKTDLEVSETNPRGGVIQFAYDSLKRLQTRIGEDGGTETFTHDADGNVTSSTDPKGHVTQYVYNGFGDVIQETSSDRGTIAYELDAEGRETKRTDSLGQVRHQTYDALGRLASITFDGDEYQNIVFYWDDTTDGSYGIGRLTYMGDASGWTNWKYNQYGRVTQENRVIDDKTFTTRYYWDASQRLVSMIYPSGRIVNYSYDQEGRTYQITTKANADAPEQVVTRWIGYTPMGSIIRGVGYGNDEQIWFSQDTSERPAQLIGQSDTDQSVNLLIQYAFGDQMNLTAIDDQMLDYLDQNFTYDAAGRLKQAIYVDDNKTVTDSWTYDLVGNRASETVKVGSGTPRVSTYTYGANDNRLASISVGGTAQRTFEHTANGAIGNDVASSATRSFYYDPMGRLMHVDENNAALGHYLYDGFSRLTVRTIGANEAGNKVLSVPMLGGGGLIDSLMPGATQAYSGLGNRIIAEADASGVTKREYIWAGNIVVGVIDAANSASPSLYFVQNDHLGRPIRMRNAAKQDVWYANYRPFGEAIIAGPASLDMRLPGQWFQMETGLSWNWHRTYDPSLGRYLQPDPLGLTDGPSVYGYAHQSPMMLTDPEGLVPSDPKFGLPNQFWKWFHKHPDFGCFKGPDGLVDKDVANQYYCEWKDMGCPKPGNGY